MQNKDSKIAYRYWQDRATPYYIAARILIKNESTPEAAALCGFQAIENIIKAALDFYNEPWDKQREGHNLSELARKLEKHNLILDIPEYLNECDFKNPSQYPESGKNNLRGSGLRIPASFIDDLDRIIFEIICKIGDKSKTRIYSLLEKEIDELSKNNKYFSQMKQFYNLA